MGWGSGRSQTILSYILGFEIFSAGLGRGSYIGSVLFRASAFTGAKLASGVPAVMGHFGPW